MSATSGQGELATDTETGVQKKTPMLGRSEGQKIVHEHDPGALGPFLQAAQR